MNTLRLKSSVTAAAIHLACSATLVILFSLFIVFLWFPLPLLDELNVRELLILLAVVDVMSGPIITLITYNPKKRKRERAKEITIIACLQSAFFAYGIFKIYENRPVFLAFEGDAVRVVRYIDIEDSSEKAKKLKEYSSLLGVTQIGTNLLKPTDPNYVQSIKKALQGIPPSFRPERWTAYETQKELVLNKIKSFNSIRQDSHYKLLLNKWIEEHNIEKSSIGYLPLTVINNTSWIALINRKNAVIVGYLPIDGWQD